MSQSCGSNVNGEYEFVSYYPGPGLYCPFGDTNNTAQTLSLEAGQWSGNGLGGGPLTMGQFTAVLYFSAGARPFLES